MAARNPRLSEAERNVIEHCQDAVAVCEWCADACAGEDGMGECVRLCRDVVDVASLHARFVARGSPNASALAELCADVCEACVEECERHDTEHCRACVEVLAECAVACRAMT